MKRQKDQIVVTQPARSRAPSQPTHHPPLNTSKIIKVPWNCLSSASIWPDWDRWNAGEWGAWQKRIPKDWLIYFENIWLHWMFNVNGHLPFKWPQTSLDNETETGHSDDDSKDIRSTDWRLARYYTGSKDLSVVDGRTEWSYYKMFIGNDLWMFWKSFVLLDDWIIK